MVNAVRAGGTGRIVPGPLRTKGGKDKIQMETLVMVIVLALFAGAAVGIVNSVLDLAGLGGQLKSIPFVGQHLDAIIVILLVWALDRGTVVGLEMMGRDSEFLQIVVDGVAVYAVIAMANAIRDGFAGRSA